MDLSNLGKVLQGEPAYRVKQAREAIFQNFILDWNEATFFSKTLREELNKECPLEIKADILVSKKERSVKARIFLKDNLAVETVLMQHTDGRNTVCVSSQVGCPLGCAFCATGKMGFKRNLTAEEIIEQVIFFNRWLCHSRESGNPHKKTTWIPGQARNDTTQFHVTNVTFMGMGEPFLNYDEVMKAVRALNNKEFFNIGARSISVSTAGIIPGIEKYANEGLQLNLAISLHAPNDKLRGELMPVNKTYHLNDVMEAVDKYIAKTKRKVMFEYVLIKGINDSDQCARELAKLMRNPSTLLRARKLYFLNLILYNSTGNFQPSESKRVEEFKKILQKHKVNFVQRYRFGDDIQAACGQFAGK